MNPDLAAFLEAFEGELVFGQALLQRAERGFTLRHVHDRAAAPGTLRLLTVDALRPLAQFTAEGVFRPLKSAPNLAAGWRAQASDAAELYLALAALYPGAAPDWFAALSDNPPITSYRKFTARQSGMYRITTHLNDATAGAAIRACCHVDFCLKRRLWSVDGLSSDRAEEKSLIPCLEPCAVLLEFARKVARWEQQGMAASVESETSGGETDFDSPTNLRRLRFLAEKQQLAV